MTRLTSVLKFIITPVIQKHWLADALFAIPRILCGLMLTAMFGADKFGMPWTADSQNLNLFEGHRRYYGIIDAQ